MAKVIIPFLQQNIPVLFNNLLDFRQFTATETTRLHLGVSKSLIRFGAWEIQGVDRYSLKVWRAYFQPQIR
jgi:hypothetical protein